MRVKGYDVFYGWLPNQVTVRGDKQHVQVSSRDGEVRDFMVEDAIEVAKLCTQHEEESEGIVLVRLRSYWGDNSNGNGRARVQILVGRKSNIAQEPFNWPNTTGSSQTLDVETEIVEANFNSDHFEGNAESFYIKD